MADRPAYSGILAEPIPRRLFARPMIVEGDVRAARKRKFIDLAVEENKRSVCALRLRSEIDSEQAPRLGTREKISPRLSDEKRQAARWAPEGLGRFSTSYFLDFISRKAGSQQKPYRKRRTHIHGRRSNLQCWL